MQTEKIVIVVPYITDTKDNIRELIPLLEKRAGVPVKVIPYEDTNRVGWVKLHNALSVSLDYDWYVYCPSDYFPGRDFIKIALETAKKYNKLMVGFNDGKWFGKNATAGIVNKKLIPKLYSGTIFYPKYEHHGADPDLTEKAMLLNEYVYAPEALLVEIDYKKDFIDSNVRLNRRDVELYLKRKEQGFPNE